MPACLNSQYSIIKSLDNDRSISDLSQSTLSINNNNNQMDSWSSILSGNKEQDSKTDLDPPPYIHPTTKRSLSDKSLEICTESLGSETGSDGFSDDEFFGSDPPKYTTTVQTKNVGSCKRSDLPPPLPSLSLQMRSRRQNGRLVMEAVHVSPFESRFRAERQDGRLLLSFSDQNYSAAGIFVPENDDVADFDGDVGDRDDEVVEVTSSGGLLKPYVWEYWRNNKLEPCKRTLLLLKETTALPLLSNI